jgi:peroxiredoxin
MRYLFGVVSESPLEEVQARVILVADELGRVARGSGRKKSER